MGDHVLLRSVWGEELWFLRPVTVVADEPEIIALYTHGGAPKIRAIDAAGKPTRIPRKPWTLVESTWSGEGVLQLYEPESWSIVTLFWETDGSFEAWYVDLCRPLRRNSRGFDYADMLLDVVIWADGRIEWKDEDEFAEAQRLGLISSEEAHKVLLEGERVIAAFEQRQGLFSASWEDWRPPKRWITPVLPEDWRQL